MSRENKDLAKELADLTEGSILVKSMGLAYHQFEIAREFFSMKSRSLKAAWDVHRSICPDGYDAEEDAQLISYIQAVQQSMNAVTLVNAAMLLAEAVRHYTDALKVGNTKEACVWFDRMCSISAPKKNDRPADAQPVMALPEL